MKQNWIKRMLCSGVLLVGSAAPMLAASQTLVGKISDSMCGASHKAMEHAGKKMTDRECVQACIKGGSKYVLVSKGKVYNISNQDFAGLAVHAGHTVNLTGEMSGDSITVSKIDMPGKAKGKTSKS